MNNNVFKVIDNGLVIGGVVVGVEMIQTVLGIVLLVLNILTICVKIGIKIYNSVKKKEPIEVNEDIDELKQVIDEGTKKNNGRDSK